MSTNNRILVTIGLTLVGSLGWAAVRDPADGPQPPSRDLSPAAAVAAPVSQEQYLLLTNGQLIQGDVSRQGAEYLVNQRVGVMRFPEKRVEGAFNSVREAYQYKVEQLPDRDYDERMKLALWCLNLKLISEARELLTDIVQHNPHHTQAQAMLASIAQAAKRAALRQRDPEVRRTGADEMADARPGALDSAVLRRAQRELGISTLPVIFDLPVPLAVKRAEEFARYINPLLQVNCAKCHNGQYDGAFQLVVTRSRADRTPEALRANLDATLRLIDPKNPAHSELLASTLRAHGRGPRPRPIFPGSNDPTYQIIAAWVHNLCPPKSGDDGNRADRIQARPDRDEMFAADRERTLGDRPDREVQAFPDRASRSDLAAGMAEQTRIPPPSRFVPRGGSVSEGSKSPDPEEFPVPFAISGIKPNLAPVNAGPKPATRSSPPAAPAGSATASGPAKPASPGASGTSPDEPTGKDEAGTAKKTRKPLTLDPKLLERALQIRNQGK